MTQAGLSWRKRGRGELGDETMTTLGKVLWCVGCIYLGITIVVIFVGQIIILFTRGFWEFWETASPFNLWNFIAIILTFAPGMLLLWLAEKAKSRGRPLP